MLTPENVAQYLNVSVDDVISTIESGTLKAVKIGSAYRISRSALDEFLRSF